MYIIEFTLKQHTPLIHFQHDQEGATLRATELKPKLDRFLRNNLLDFADYKSYLLSYNAEDDKKYGKDYEANLKNYAFNYKVKIIPKGLANKILLPVNYKKDKYLTKAFPFMLSNMGGKEDESELHNFSFYEEIILEFSSRFEALLKEIQYFLPYFLASFNFGNRQNKGFGCFFLKDSSRKDFEDIVKESNPGNPIFRKKISFPVSVSLEYYENLFKTFERDYKKLKSGIADDESRLKLFFESNDIFWEKSAIKEHIRSQKFDPSNYKYIRIFLGLAEHFEYIKQELKIKIKNVPENEESEIERFRSPITFKVFENFVYLIPEQIGKNEDIFDKKFSFTFESQKDPRINNTEFVLRSPSREDFPDVFPEQFLQQYCTELGWTEI